MYNDIQTPQILYPPPSLIPISPPPPLYTPPNPQTLLILLKNIFLFIIHLLLAPFSAKLVPCHPSHPYGIELPLATPAPPTTVVVPVRRERGRRRSKSPSSSPSSLTLTEGTMDGDVRGGG